MLSRKRPISGGVAPDSMTSTRVQIYQWLEALPSYTDRLQGALVAVLQEVLGGAVRPTDIESTFDFGMSMASRLNRAAYADSPRDIAVLLPGRPTMLRFMERAQQLCRRDDLISTLRESYEEFSRHVAQVASTHQELSSLLNAHDPEHQRDSDERRRAAFFRAATDLYGGFAEGISNVNLFLPNPKSSVYGDYVHTRVYHRLRRLGVMQSLVVGSGTDNPGVCDQQDSRSFVDKIASPYASGFVVRELSSDTLPSYRTVRRGNAIRQIFLSEDLPLGTPIDIGTVMANANWVKNIAREECGTFQQIVAAIIPCRRCVIDFIVHKEMWPGITPVLKMYRYATMEENLYPDDRWYDEVPFFDELQELPPNRALMPPKDMPKHTDVIRYLLNKTQININDFRIYRLMVQYPVIGQSLYIFFSRKGESPSGE